MLLNFLRANHFVFASIERFFIAFFYTDKREGKRPFYFRGLHYRFAVIFMFDIIPFVILEGFDLNV